MKGKKEDALRAGSQDVDCATRSAALHVHLGKGATARPRCIPHASAAIRHRASRDTETGSRFIAARGSLHAPP